MTRPHGSLHAEKPATIAESRGHLAQPVQEHNHQGEPMTERDNASPSASSPMLVSTAPMMAQVTSPGWMENNSWWDAAVQIATSRRHQAAISIQASSSVAFVPMPPALAEVAATIAQQRSKVSLSLSGIIVPGEKVKSGVLVAVTSFVWVEIARRLGADWSVAYEIPAGKWEEIIAGAFHEAGYD
jgi:hypothetical protein